MKLLIAFAFAFLWPLAVFSQEKACPVGLICLTQAEANRAADLARENPVLKEKIGVLEQALADKDKNYADLKAAKEQNESDLKEAMHATEVKLAEKTGEVIQLEADRVRQNAIMDILIRSSRAKKIGLINF